MNSSPGVKASFLVLLTQFWEHSDVNVYVMFSFSLSMSSLEVFECIFAQYCQVGLGNTEMKLKIFGLAIYKLPPKTGKHRDSKMYHQNKVYL